MDQIETTKEGNKLQYSAQERVKIRRKIIIQLSFLNIRQYSANFAQCIARIGNNIVACLGQDIQ